MSSANLSTLKDENDDNKIITSAVLHTIDENILPGFEDLELFENFNPKTVFYALSNEYLKKINQNDLWNNLWINNIGNSKQANKVYSAECILKFLQNI